MPDVLYWLPFVNGKRDYKCAVDDSSFHYAQSHASPPPPPVSLEYLRVAQLIITENNITHMPFNTYEALHLYFLLVTSIENY